MSQTQPTRLSDDDLADRAEAEEAALLNDIQTLPDVPTEAREFGKTIEFVKNMLALINSRIGILKELAATIKGNYTKEVRGDRATLSEKDKAEIARRCGADETLKSIEARVTQFSDAWVRWDARRSRLNRDFEVARIDYEFRRRLAAADHEANRRRNSS